MTISIRPMQLQSNKEKVNHPQKLCNLAFAMIPIIICGIHTTEIIRIKNKMLCVFIIMTVTISLIAASGEG